MNDQTDPQLLRGYVEHRSEAAFTELVRRHLDIVHSAALRMVCDSHLAQDVTQGVFVALARNAAELKDRPVLSGWLHRTAQNIAAQTVRTDVRRRVREQEAAAMNELLSAEPDVVWEHIAPHLDGALGELSEADRDALMLRYFERKSAGEMATTLGISDEAAQKRVSRAVERLREFFARRGITVGASGLVVVISANAVQAAPVGLVVTISTAAALTGTTLATTATATAIKTIAMTTLQKVVITAALTIIASVGIYEVHRRELVYNSVPVEPVYQGKTLRYWIAGASDLPNASNRERMAYRRATLLAMGKPAVRYLHWMIAHPKSLETNASNYIDPENHPANYYEVILAIKSIGSGASEVAPDLVRLWENGNQKFSTYNGFPIALAEMGNSLPEVIAALHRHFTSRDQMHGALSALAAWRLNQSDTEASDIVRRSLTFGVGNDVPYVLLEILGEIGTKATPFVSEIRDLIDKSASARPDQQAKAAMAKWRLFHQPDQAVTIVQRLGELASKADATANEVNQFVAAARELMEIPEPRQASIHILKELTQHSDESASQFCSQVLTSLERVESGR